MDMPINETEIIQNIKNSEGYVSRETLISQHPYVKNADKEIQKINQETSDEIGYFNIND
jgi:hypothetical protein